MVGYCFLTPLVSNASFKGIFGYLNHLVPRTRHRILQILLQGLQRLEYRGYDSAGVAFDDLKEGEEHIQ